MKRKFTKIMAAFALLTFLIPMTGWGQAPVNTVLWAEDFSGYSANNVPSGSITDSHTGTTVYGGVTLTYACTGTGTKIYVDTQMGGNESQANLLIAKSNGSFSVSGISTGGATELTLAYDKTGQGTLSISTTTSGVTISGSTITTNGASTIDLVFTNTKTDKNLRFDNVQVTVKTAGSGGGSQLTPSDLTITNQSTALTFDLYNNSNAQVINYTTTSTGAISINPASPTSYFSYVHDANAKTITVTPLTVTPSAQTVTISQEADATYDAGSVSFTVSVANSDPNQPGTQNNPYTVAQAKAVIDQGTPYPTGVYVTGIVCTASSNLYSNQYLTYWISDDGTTADRMEAYNGLGLNQQPFTSVSDVAVGDVVVIYGDLYKHNSTYELNTGNYLVSLTHGTTPSISANNITLPYDATSGEIAYTITNPATGVNPTATLQSGVNWITNLAVDANNNKVTFTTTANEGNADRQATITLSYTGATNKVVTVTQQHYVADYAALPFSFDGGSGDIANTAGLTASGLGSDYDNSPKLKFNDTDDYLILKINERPGTLTFDIKGNSFSGGTFKVQTSEDGQTYTDLETYSSLTTTLQHESFDNLGANVRYIKWVYTNKDNGNVALGNIALAAYVAPQPSITVAPATVNETSGEQDGTLDITYANLQISDMTDFGIQFYDANNNELNGSSEPDWVEVLVAEQDPQIGEGYVVSYTIDANEGPARTAYFKVFAMGDNDFVYSNLVTVNQAAVCAPAPTTGGWVLTNLADLAAGDVFVIVSIDENDAAYAMSNDQGTQDAPTAVSVTINGNELTGTIPANIKWNISGDATNGYTFYPDGDNTTWLYNTGSNAKCLVGTNVNSTYVFDNTYGYLKHVGTDKYIGVYNSQNWRGYVLSSGSIHSNISGQTFGFYKNTNVATETLTIQPYSGDGGYYLIASPFNGVEPTVANGFLTNDYDLYRFDQSREEEWLNYEVTPFYLLSGKGYLYASATATTLTFTGVPYNGNGQVALTYDAYADLPGWNLIGNPYANAAILKDANNGNKAFYTLNGAGSELEAPTPGTAIAAMQGVFVEAANNGEVVTFVEQQPAPAPVNSNYISLNVSRNRGGVIDRALIGIGEGPMLHKFQLNPNNTKIYITEANQDYAIVRSSSEAEVPVSFRASENGSYTISVDAENMEMTYLHLIDNMTGADVDLLATPSYTFEAKTTDYASRFRLVFSAEENGASTGSATFAFFNGSEWTISNIGEATLQVVDVMGRILSTETVNGNTTISLNQVPGVYMLRLVNGNNVRTQKVVVR